jgi:uncharacterized protein
MTPTFAITPAVARCLPFAAFMVLLALRSLFEGHTVLDTRWLYAVQAGVAALGLAWLWRRYGELHGAHVVLGPARALLLSVAAGLVVFVLWLQLTAPWMRLGEPATTFVPVGPDGRLQWPLILLRCAGAVLVVPLIEELFWRSFLMRWLDRRDFLSQRPQATSAFALMASSAVFALGHDLWLAAFIAGLVFGALYRHTGQIWHAVVAHAVANAALAAWVVTRRDWGFW